MARKETVAALHGTSTPSMLDGMLNAAALRWPDAIALETPTLRLDYRTLADQVAQRAATLTTAGFLPGDRIGIAASRSPETVIAILAVLQAGLAYVPLDLTYPADRLQAMLADAAPRAVIGEAEAMNTLAARVGALPKVDHPAPVAAAPHGAIDGLAYVLFTSGSTGRPKGVAMSRGPLAHLIDWHRTHPRLGKTARTLQFAPLSFDVHFQEILSSIACGGTLVLIPDDHRRDPELLRQALADMRVDRLFLPYVALQMLAQADEAALATGAARLVLADVVSAGEQLQVTPSIRALFERQPGAVLHNHYGPTESHVVTAFELSGPAAQWPAIPPIGTALPHVELALRNPDSGGITHGDSGELLLGGACLAEGYLGRPELSAERFLDNPAGLAGRWYVTGDLVQRDAQGVYTYLGRCDQQLKVDGFRIEPGEIELALMAHEQVRDAAVTAPELPGVGRQLLAHVVPRDGANDWQKLQHDLRQWLRGRVPDYMIPVRFLPLERMPTTPSGKIDRRNLPLPEAPAKGGFGKDSPRETIRRLWQDLLGLDSIADEANLFDLGARSLLVMRFVSQAKASGLALSVADVYDRPTIAGMAQRLDGSTPRTQRSRSIRGGGAGDGIAIVGLAVRADNAHDVDTFWNNLLNDRESIRRFSPEEIDPSVPESLRRRSNFVAARGVLEDADRFDAAFFGISAREATLLDPQQRLFLELCWSALEDAAVDPARFEGDIGVYAGTANNTYLPAVRNEAPELIQQYGEFATMLASEKDYVATRAANRLNLRGPAVSIHTACSTSLVAIAQAWHALAQGQCDIALAGGVTVVVPQAGGYLHVEGGMESADGRCRPFDAEASGTVFASGGGVVALKRLGDAVADGDPIYAVIKGVGLNNDGGEKASFTAPSVTGQAAAIRMALDHAGVDARSIGYVEAHGTGTALGDPIEIAALTRAWSEDTDDRQFCRIGSVKGHLGHTVAAAGVLGLIKAALALHRQRIPGTLHFRQPNPQIDFSATPFSVSADATPWPRETQPRRAAVSSFGVGGTNAHVIVEEAPIPAPAPPTQDAVGLHLWPLSARSAEAALQRAHDLADHLERHPGISLDDITATLCRGRQPMTHRLAVVATDAASAIDALRRAKSTTQALAKPRLVFLFSGQGSQHPGMARQLVDAVPAFRDAFDRCLAQMPPTLAADLRAWMVECAPDDDAAAARLAETRHAQPALFCISYSLAAWLDSLGLRPDAMIGHSIGEYAAACHAGVLSLADAVAAVIARGQAMFAQAPGAMLAVRAGADAVTALLPPDVEIAAANAPGLTVVAGGFDAIDAFAAALADREIEATRLKVSHAFHSATMDGALPLVAQALGRTRLGAPATTVYSCVSGAPLTAAEATDPQYWARQVRAPVQFSRAVQAELDQGDTVFVEVGPGQALTALVRQHRDAQNSAPRIVPLLGPAQDPGAPAARALQGVAALWCSGLEVAWPVPVHAPRLSLPTYPFQGERYWFPRRPATGAMNPATITAAGTPLPAAPLSPSPENTPPMSRLPRIEQALVKVFHDVAGLPADAMDNASSFVDQGLDSLSMTQVTLELEQVFGIKLRFRRLLEDLNTLGKLAAFLDTQLPADKFSAAAVPAPVSPAPAAAPTAIPLPTFASPAPGVAPLVAGDAVQQLIQQQMQLMAQQLALLSGQVPAAVPVAPVSAPATLPTVAPAAPPQGNTAPAVALVSTEGATAQASLVEKPFGASARITLQAQTDFTREQRRWLEDFIARYNAKTIGSKNFSQKYRKVMADPRVVTGFNPLWKDLVYPIVADRSKGARVWDVDGNEYIDLLSCFGGNLLGYQPEDVTRAMVDQLHAGIEVGPQHPDAATVAELIAEFTGMERVAFCNTGSEAVMGAMRIARTVTGRKTIAIFTNSYHGIFDEVIVRGTRQLRSLSAAPGILANAVENVLVLDYDSEASLETLRARGHELAAIMIEPIQNKYPTLQPRAFVQALRKIADDAGCALIFDEVVTGFRVGPGGAQEFYGVRADVATYGKVIGGGLPFAAIAGSAHWLDALDGGHWQYGDDSYPEAGVTYFAGTFVRHPLALAAAKATLLHLKRGGRQFYQTLAERTQGMVDRLNAVFAARGAPVKAVHCASLWRLSWDDNLKYVGLFYYLARFHGLHLYEQFGHFVTEAMGEAETDRIVDVFTRSLDELMALGFIQPRDGGTPPPKGGMPEKLGTSPATQSTPIAAAAPSTLSPAPSTGPALREAPLTPGQTERWLAASFDPAARRALNESFCLSLSGDVDPVALKAAIEDVLARHEAFRLHFNLDQPQQLLDAPAPIAIEYHDLRHLPDADGALDAFCADASLRDFPLDQAPLAAVSLLRLADGRAVVHLVASHLIFDGWASSVFNSELAAAYHARCRGHPAALPTAESPLRFASDEQQRMAGPDGEESLNYWRRCLANPPVPLALGDRIPPTPRQYAADTLRSRIDGALLDGLRHQARQAGATLFQLLLGAVTVVLRQASGQDEFVVSIPYASQNLGRHGPLLADGVLDLPLRLGCHEGDSGATLLARVRNQLLDALEYPLATQGTVDRALGIVSSGDSPALTGVFFNLNPKVDLSGFAPLSATMHEGRKRGTLHQLFFNFYEQDSALTLDLHYSTEFFSPERARDLVDALRAVCACLARDLETPLNADAAGRLDQRLKQWNATEAPLEAHPRIERWVARQAGATPDAIAVECRDGSLSYQALDTRANRYAQLLRSRGIGPGSRVGLCLSRGVELLPALLGVLKSGAAYVPLDPGFPRDRLHYMAEDAGVALVITEAAHADKTGVPRALQLRTDEDAGHIAAAPDQPPLLPAQAEDATAYVIYTSGSTGKPKGVVLPQRAVCNFLASMRREPGLTSADKLLAVTTLSFDIAVLELLLPLTCGARVVIAEREDAMDGEALRTLIGRHGINVMQATPTTWHLLLDAGWQAPRGFKALCGGEPLPPALAARLLDEGIELWNMYGPTETTVWSTLGRVAAGRKITIGHPIANTQVWILDDRMNPCPIGAEGEICIGGSGVAAGYHNRPELTAERFVADPFSTLPNARLYRTGDLGRWREDGTLEHLGRLDFQVKIRGYRIELGEIETRLAEQAGVARCVVMAREDQPGDVALVAYAVPRAGAVLDGAGLRESLRTDLPDYMVPRTVLVLDTLPLLPNGKIDRKALPAPGSTATVAPPPAPASDGKPAGTPGNLVQTIAAAMAKVLGIATVADHDNFFNLGGHSLLAAKLSADLVAAVGHRPSLRVIFESPTPATLARALLGATATAPVTANAIPVRAEQDVAPLSIMQQRIWFLESLSPGMMAHNMPSGHLLSGPLDVAAFKRAFALVVQRQSVLRTHVERTASGDRQRIRETLESDLLPVDDLTRLSPDKQQATMARTIEQLVHQPFHLEQGPLFVARLFRLAPDRHGFFFSAHHLIWDGASFDLFYNEMAEAYAACLAGRAPQLPALTVSYGDFAAWHATWLSGAELERQTRYWTEQLTPLPPPLDLPTDRPRPAQMSGQGSAYQFNLPGRIAAVIREQAVRQGRTPYVTLLAAYALVLHRLCQQDDFVVGTPVRGREQPALEPLMGFFVNMLPLRLTVDSTLRFSDWLTSIQQQVVTSFSCPDVPFEHLVRALKVPRDGSRPPIHQVSFSYQDVRERPTRWGNVDHQRMETPLLGSTQDLGLWCVETRDHIEYVFTFNTDVLDTASVALIAQRLASVLEQIAANPDLPLADYDVATPAERALLAQWNATDRDYDRAASLAGLVAAQAARSPQATALAKSDGARMSYAELEQRTNRLARQLRARGIARGARVGLCLERGLDMVVALLACLKAGAAYVPLDPAYPADRLDFMAKDAGLALLISQTAWQHAVHWPRDQVLLLDGDAAAIAAETDAPLAPDASRDARPEDPAYVIYTSGSTGKPKGVMVPQGAVVNFLVTMAREPGLGAKDRLVAVTTLSFDIAVLELLLPLTVGATAILASADQVMDGKALRDLVEQQQATAMQATPSAWRMLIAAGWRGKRGFKALVGGEALAPDLAQQLLERCDSLWNMYGPTETTVWSTCWRVEHPENGIYIGGPIANTQIHVLDDRLRPCPLDVSGEIYIGGEGVTLGYLNRPELMAERFIPDPFSDKPGARLYRTGDRGRWRRAGLLEHLGRLDFQVKVRGHRIELGEIEACLSAHPDVAECVTMAREDVPGDVRLVAYYTPRAGSADEPSLRAHLRAALPGYMVPQHLMALPRLPLLPNGKIDRKALPVPAAAPEDTASPPPAATPMNPTEQRLAQVWRDLLKTGDIRPDDNFFDLGGHSLLVMQAILTMEAQTGKRLNPRRFIFESLKQIARAYDEMSVEPSATPGLIGRLFAGMRGRRKA